jgi:hypothetical protein
MNGQERADESFLAFQNWVSAKTEADFREIVTKGRLNRGEICRECNFGRSALVQNPRIKEALSHLEEQLRARGVLPAFASDVSVPFRPKGQFQSTTDAERLRKLEAENAGLRAELAEARSRLRRFESLETLLIETGRLAR